jgi:hypothetical protein
MKLGGGLTLTLAPLLAAALSAAAATRGQEIPDKEMLRMMEFLKEMELIRQMDMLRELHQVDGGGEPVKNSQAAPLQKKGTVK